MITPYLIHLGVEAAPVRVARPSRTFPPSETLHYRDCRPSKPMLVIAGLASIGVHLVLLFGFGHARKAPATAKVEENVIALSLALTQIKELEEPEPVAGEDAAPTPDMATLVPMQADLPQLPRPNDFVQQINFASLLEQPDFSDVKVTVIPETFRGGRKLAETIGNIFNLADLDRVPEPILQPAPLFPVSMRRESLTATVTVEFVVDTQGAVIGAMVFNSTNGGFDSAAVAGVSKWKFRAGIKDGRKVNTRMRVPILFAYSDPD